MVNLHKYIDLFLYLSFFIFVATQMIPAYQYKRRTHKRLTPQTLDSTNVRRTNVGPVQTSDQYKRRTGTNVGPVQTSDRYIYKKKTSDMVDFEWTIVLKNFKL